MGDVTRCGDGLQVDDRITVTSRQRGLMSAAWWTQARNNNEL